MLILGLLLLVAAGVLTAGLLEGSAKYVNIDIFGQTLTHVSLLELFILGVCTGVVVIAGLVLFFSGLRRGSRKRKARRLETNTKRAREGELKEENARLARELAQQRRSGAGPVPPSMPSTATQPGSPATQQGSTTGQPSAPATPASPPASEMPHHDRTTVMGAPATSAAQPPAEAPEPRP